MIDNDILELENTPPLPCRTFEYQSALTIIFVTSLTIHSSLHIALNWWFTEYKMNGEVIFVPMGHCKVTTNTTDMHSQTEVKCKLPEIANGNMHSK